MDLLTSDGANGGLRVRRPNSSGAQVNSTVSEGIAYGMLASVYMDDQPTFDGLWSYETAHDPFLPLFAAALATERISLGTGIAVAFARTPFAMAQTAWDLQRASGGRLLLGLGTQVRAHVERLVSTQGKLFSRKRTGLPAEAQRKVALALKRARFMAMMPYIT